MQPVEEGKPTVHQCCPNDNKDDVAAELDSLHNTTRDESGCDNCEHHLKILRKRR